jgi:hypothetical protein
MLNSSSTQVCIIEYEQSDFMVSPFIHPDLSFAVVSENNSNTPLGLRIPLLTQTPAAMTQQNILYAILDLGPCPESGNPPLFRVLCRQEFV